MAAGSSEPDATLAGEPEYVWEVATLFPEQGRWSEAAYLSLTDSTNRLVELLDGFALDVNALFAVADELQQ